MKSLCELVMILSILTLAGALFWAALGVISVGHSNDEAWIADREAGMRRALVVAAMALAVYLSASYLKKRQ